MREAVLAFFSTNMVVVLFSYGLSFFVMGFAISLQSRRPSTLRLARHLPMLGSFGILHALADWGAVFIPIQETYMPERAIVVLQAVDAALTALSFTFLLAFGLGLLTDTLGRHLWLRKVPAAALLIWGVSFILFPLAVSHGDYGRWLAASDTWARYLIGFSGAVTTAYALRLQVDDFRRMRMEPLIRPLQWAVFSFGVYAVAGGLITHNAGFFPSTVINTASFFAATGLPIYLFRGLTGLGMAYFMIRVMEMYDIENARRMEEAERVRAVLGERDRIARELHDGVIQMLYATGLNLENALYELSERPEEGKRRIQGVLRQLDRAVKEIRNYIMELKVPGSSQRSFPEKLEALVSEMAGDLNAPVALKVDGSLPAHLADGAGNDLLQVVREALSNAARHSGASRITVTAQAKDGELAVTIADDGRGFDPELVKSEGGHHQGLRNMRRRVALLGGELEVVSRPGIGTQIRARLPLAGLLPPVKGPTEEGGVASTMPMGRGPASGPEPRGSA